MATLHLRNPDGTERFVKLSKRITSVGRDSASDVVLGDPALPNTALHVHFDGRDFNAACHEGVEMTVNGKKKITCRLTEGDVVKVGDAELAFTLRDPPTPAREEKAQQGEGVAAMETLVRFSERLLSAAGVGTLLEELLDAVVEVTHADKGFLILLEDGRLAVKAARNLARENIEDAVSRVSDSIVQKVVRTRAPLVVADALHEAEWKDSSSVVNLKLCSVMCAPLTERGEVFGVIYLGNDNVVNLFEPRDLAVLTVFGAQASLLVRNALLLDQLKSDNARLRGEIEDMHYGEIIGACAAMKDVYKRIEKIAPTDVGVLITGETGTGKELIAKEIHARSARKAGPFIAVNCGAIPEGLLESELFGYVKGAFTGATATRQGKFQAANGGTLFLDEVGEMPASLQVKILRALQERVVNKVGETRPEAVDIRVVAATNKVLEEEIKKGTFREDLYYRLNVVTLRLPPLRERGEDVVVLGRFFLQRYGKEFQSKAKGFAPNAIIAMRKYGWPGNIRELENRVKKAVVLADKALVSADDLDLRPENLEPVLALAQAKEEFQKRYINEVLERNGGNRTKTAKDLGVDPRTIFRHLEKLEAEKRGEELPPSADDAELG